ncbi:MAG: site-2 protease family protein [Actinomycetes bacterium]
MLSTIGIIAFIIAILFSIGWHELGHLLAAKKCGVKVTEYMIGFGPRLWSTTKGDTEYGVKAIPFGGYIRMIGMFPPGADGKVKTSSTSRVGALIDEARKQSQEEVLSDEDDRRTFYRLPVRQKLLVMLAGPVMNLILAFILFAIVLVGFGTPGETMSVSAVAKCVPAATATSSDCPAGAIPSPAAEAGLKVGDTVVALNGKPVESWSAFSTAVRSSPAGPATVTVQRNGQQVVLNTDIRVVDRAVVKDGQVTDQIAPQGFFGMSPERELQPQSIWSVPQQMWTLTMRTAAAMVAIPSKLSGVAQAAFAGEARDPNGPVGMVGVTRISGEVAAAEAIPTSWKIAQLLGMVASLNLFLCLFNLIPLLPLDGGHAAGAVWEGIRRQIAKWRHRPDPGYVDVARALPVAYAVAFLLIGMSGLLLYADVVNPIHIGG